MKTAYGYFRLLGFGRMGRSQFTGWGLALLALFYNLDRLDAFDGSSGSLKMGYPERLEILYRYGFHWIPWTPSGVGQWLGIGLALVGWGSLSTARLRDAGVKPLWGLLMLIPAVRMVFFALLAVIPSATTHADQDLETPPRLWRRWLPKSRWGCAITSSLCTGLVGVILTVISTKYLREYGWSLFVAMPFVLGMVSTAFFSLQHPLSRKDAIHISTLSVFALGLLLFAFAIEGVICLAMAAPVAAGLAMLGGWISWCLIEIRQRKDQGRLMGVALLAMPMVLAAEKSRPPEPPVFSVTTEVFIATSAERLWPFVVNVARLPDTETLWSRAGIATFQRAWTEGQGQAAVRYCEFNTGLAREPVEVWDPPYRLHLKVESTPVPMKEWTVYKEIHPEHLDGFYQVKAAAFDLQPVAGGTLLRGTTSYQHGLWPANYWAWWSNQVVRDLQRRVLTEAKRRAEAEK